MPSRFDSPRFAVLAVAIAAVLFFSINVLANLWLGKFRIDATQGGAYTISKQIKPVFENIDEPITVRLYYSEALGAASPRHAALYRRVRELLEQYAKLSKGKINVVYENPEPFSDTEDRAVGFGLQAVPLGDMGEVAYFGLAATNATDDQQVIPFFNLEREQFVEYDLTKLIYSLSKPNQAKIGLISSLQLAGGMGGGQMGMGGQQTPPWAVMGQIKDFFDVRELDINVTDIPKDISLLMLVQPSNLTPATQFAIDQFVLRGGRLLVFVDPNPESAGTMGGSDNLDGIKKLMTAWGVNLVDGKIAGDLDAAIRVNSDSGDHPIVSDYVAWLQLGPENFDRQDAIIGDLKQIDVGTAGLLEKIGNATTTVTPLLMTGTKSMRIDVQKVQGMPDIVGLFRDFKPGHRA
ncbi:MAG: hypothetical protein EPO08_05930 [Rhodospirillaceae bacterium]|nr:MAG: hypothetical protein EPO08_05930 [Rhodospirillaceae bacterium]